jgi:hypothetical protein
MPSSANTAVAKPAATANFIIEPLLSIATNPSGLVTSNPPSFSINVDPEDLI